MKFQPDLLIWVGGFSGGRGFSCGREPPLRINCPGVSHICFVRVIMVYIVIYTVIPQMLTMSGVVYPIKSTNQANFMIYIALILVVSNDD